MSDQWTTRLDAALDYCHRVKDEDLKRRRAEATNIVYVLRVSGAIKVGITNSVIRRIREVNTHSPTKCTLGFAIRLSDSRLARDIENEFHRKFLERNTNGEWFSIDSSVAISEIIGICNRRGVAFQEVSENTEREARKLVAEAKREADRQQVEAGIAEQLRLQEEKNARREQRVQKEREKRARRLQKRREGREALRREKAARVAQWMAKMGE